MTTKIKPCPFCGGEAIHLQEEGSGAWYCWCDRCGAQTRNVGLPQQSSKRWDAIVSSQKRKATRLWNRRSP